MNKKTFDLIARVQLDLTLTHELKDDILKALHQADEQEVQRISRWVEDYFAQVSHIQSEAIDRMDTTSEQKLMRTYRNFAESLRWGLEFADHEASRANSEAIISEI